MLVFEKSRAGRGMSMLPACDVEIKKGEFMRVVYFTIPQDSKIIGYMQ